MKRFLLAFIMLAVSVQSYALDVNAGVKAGINAGSFFSSDFVQSGSQSANIKGFSGALFAEIGFIDYFSLQPEISIGFNNAVILDSGNLQAYSTWRNVQFDLFIKGRIPIGNLLKIYLGVAPTISLNWGDNIYADNSSADAFDLPGQGIPARNFGFSTEIGMEFNLPVGYIIGAVRSQIIIFSMSNGEGDSITAHASPISIQIGYGYRF
jgi:hypothetical protein